MPFFFAFFRYGHRRTLLGTFGTQSAPHSMYNILPWPSTPRWTRMHALASNMTIWCVNPRNPLTPRTPPVPYASQ